MEVGPPGHPSENSPPRPLPGFPLGCCPPGPPCTSAPGWRPTPGGPPQGGPPRPTASAPPP
eukprot:11198850-Lingulodinium_polyedra.AAC.1